MKNINKIMYQIKRNQIAQSKARNHSDDVKERELLEKEEKLILQLAEIVGMNYVQASESDTLHQAAINAGIKNDYIDMLWILGDGSWC